MDNYYQPPQFNQPSYDYSEAENKRRFYMEKARMEKKEIRHLGNVFGIVMSAFILLQLVCVFLLKIFGLEEIYNNSALFQTCFSIVVVDLICIVIPFGLMAYLNRKKYTTDVIPTKKVSGKTMYLWVTFGMFCCVASNYIVGIVVSFFQALGHDPFQYETPEPDSFVTSIEIV